ncbi:MAG TPA: response regulator transcription factor [Burkholderiales bacterium]|nr:response regulator transcription factor [Burkholderiales bacterium]
MQNATATSALNHPAPRRGDGAAVHLTPRQLEVLALLCEGLSNKIICRRLSVSTGTVKVHVSNILRELGVNSRLQAVLEARRRRLLNE